MANKGGAAMAKVTELKPKKTPEVIFAELSKSVIGQDDAKKTLATAAYYHQKGFKQNVLLVGPTGVGKTFLMQRLGEAISTPVGSTDATTMTGAGYLGADVDSSVAALYHSAGKDKKKAENGIVFVDEIDKVAKTKTHGTKDIGGEAVQQGFLKMMEGSKIGLSDAPHLPKTYIDTDNMMFVFAGAFAKNAKLAKGELFTDHDLISYGMIPEFVGRLTAMSRLHPMTAKMLQDIMLGSTHSPLLTYTKLMAAEGIKLSFKKSAVELIAEHAMKQPTGARSLKAVCAKVFKDLMFKAPGMGKGAVEVTTEYVTDSLK